MMNPINVMLNRICDVMYVYKRWLCWYNIQEQVKLTCDAEKQDSIYT